ncbi:GDSL-type esterase/lipase family protein [Bradyrhizobium liaoningense]|uniref:GDSL-type esterase/lipase family protein n=1 Tax=Bradyrhizobium liaoningense TaxID=43992 RepID=UPI001BA5DD9F|nr:GDSL-type esterase/lipase family protein [Bradyrhizobium liaoningense]MBR0713533.1 acyl-CoA thioesterase [Bradyrhizobium liaoningense]
MRTFRPLAISTIAACLVLAAQSAIAATVVALGASNTYGKGVGRGEAYPAQLQQILRAKGHNVTVVNAGINGNTTEQMLARFDSAVPKGTSVVILQPGGNDRRKGKSDTNANIAAIESRAAARGIRVVMMSNGMLHGLPHQADGQHLTPEGYRLLAQAIASQVEGALGR